jgi:dihydroorotate dehydrogenase
VSLGNWIYYVLGRTFHIQQTLPLCPTEAMGLHFPNPVGLAAGYDRDGRRVGWLAPAGFGFVEIGTINVNSEAAANTGLAGIADTLQRARARGDAEGMSASRQLLGVSLGSVRDSLDDRMVADYLRGMEALWKYADYLVINLSRPGSPGRGSGSNGATAPRPVLEGIKRGHEALGAGNGGRVPIIVKVAIEAHHKRSIPDTIVLARELGFDGVIAAFEHWTSRKDVIKCIREFSISVEPLSLIVVGGIRTMDDAWQSLEAGADLVQLFTVLVKRGPLQTRRMISRLIRQADSGCQKSMTLK